MAETRVLGVLAALLAALGAVAEPLHPQQVYRVVESTEDGGTVTNFLAPGVVFAEAQELARLTASNLSECAQLCRADASCAAFEYCETLTGCDVTSPPLGILDCRLVTGNCSLDLPLSKFDKRVRRITGFPLKHEPPELPGFNTVPVQALTGGDFTCPGSVLEGRCAFDSVLSAASVCSSMPTCRSVIYFHNGADGCSDPVAVLTTSWLTEGNAFVVPTADVLTKNDDAGATTMLMASDGTVVSPSGAELASAANASDPSTAWLGCIVAEGALMDGTVVAVEDNTATAEECCRACRADTGCNVWNYCGRADSCSYTASSPVTGNFTVNLTQGQCELRYQEIVDPVSGWPPIVLAKGSDVPLTAGSPLAVAGPQLPGYVSLPGRRMSAFGAFECPDSTMADMQECVLVESPQQLAARCDADLDCVAFGIKPLPGPPSPLRTGILKHGFNESQLGLSPTDFVYLHASAGSAAGSTSSSGLAGGAIAGIVVGCCAAVAVLAGAVWLVLQRRRQRQPCLPVSSGWGSSKDKQLTGSSERSKVGDASSQEPPSTCAPSSTQPLGSRTGQPCSSANGGAPGSSGSQTGGSVQDRSSDALAGGLPAGPPLMQTSQRVSWAPTATASPFAADAAMPFAAAQPPVAGAASGSLSPGGAGSQQYTNPRGTGVQPIMAADAEAAVAAAARTGASTGSSNPDSSEQPLPELAQYVAQCDAALSTNPSVSLVQPQGLISAACLPASLRGSVADVSKVRYLTAPDGRLQEIGSGASGTVYRALYLNEIVAAKEIDIGRSQAAQEAFVNEALWLHQLHHPHVVALLGVTIAGSTGILLMEYCAGRDLRSVLGLTAAGSNQRLFGWYRRGRRVVLEVAKALNFLHARGVVHMDVKSNNVLLTAGGTAKLADVGLSRLQTGTYLSDVPLVGTFAWIAPEVLMGGKQCSSAVDIYSLGVVMWEIITGERPQRGSLRSPHVPEECPQDAADLMMECLRLEPSQRPTAAQVVRRLESGRSRLEEPTVEVPLRSATPGSSDAAIADENSRSSGAARAP